MHDRLARLARIDGQYWDIAAAIAIGCVSVVELAIKPARSAGLTVAVLATTALGCAAVVTRRRYPVAMSVAYGGACCVPGLIAGARWWNALPAVQLLPCLILAYTVGAQVDGVSSVLGLVAAMLGVSAGDFSDPVVLFVFTIPAWAAGTVMKSRNRLTVALDAQARELEQEREAFAREAVRYERARIARDLHDIVAHNLSMIVVQAGAGRRALASNPAVASESLAHIQDGARQAELEIDQLVELLGDGGPSSAGAGLGSLDELVRRAAATGLSVTYRFSGTHDHVPAPLAEAAYRITQEGITNALKHAPTAPITVEVHAGAATLQVAVENGPPGGGSSGLESAGGGHGLVGLRERLGPVGGSLDAGPTPGGGWRVEARLGA
jgi:signal transduction histidine kinase